MRKLTRMLFLFILQILFHLALSHERYEDASSRARALNYLNLCSRNIPNKLIRIHSAYRGIREYRGTTQEDNAPSEHFGFQSHRRINPPPPPFSLFRGLWISLDSSDNYVLGPYTPTSILSPHKRIDLATSSLARNPSFLVEEFLLRVPSLETIRWRSWKKIRNPLRIFRNPRKFIFDFPDNEIPIKVSSYSPPSFPYKLGSAIRRDRDKARISRFSGERSGWTGSVRERTITSGNNYRLARPRGPPSRLLLHPEIPMAKNALRGQLLSRYETARDRNETVKERRREFLELNVRRHFEKS